MAPATLNSAADAPVPASEGELGLTQQQLADFERDGARVCREKASFEFRSLFNSTDVFLSFFQPRPRHCLLSLSLFSHPFVPASASPHPSKKNSSKNTIAGFLVIPDFASETEVSSLLSRGRRLLSTFDPASVASVFSTRVQSASVSAQYFAESASKLSFFFEEGAVVAKKNDEEEGGKEAEEERENGGGINNAPGAAFDGATLSSPAAPGAFELSVPKENAVNKIGHALHDEDDAFRAFSRENPRLLALLKSLNFEKPTPVQSMYICKPPKLGGEVVPHQDACFLRTEPRRSVTGCWLALERAGVDNGCLWAVPGSHKKVEENDDDCDENDGGLFLGHGRVFGRRDDGSVGWSDQAKNGKPSGPPEFSTVGAVPLEARPGTLVVLDGAVVHFSKANDGTVASFTSNADDSGSGKPSQKSAQSRHAYALHFVEGGKGLRWSERNWLQRSEENPFVPLFLK